VRLLFDANLSPRLTALLQDVFPGSVHVLEVGSLAADDNFHRMSFVRSHNAIV
jgi:hypothetical protein